MSDVGQRSQEPANKAETHPGQMSEAERDRQKDRDIVKRAEVALRELEMSAITQADKTRIDRVWRGLRSLDDEQADSKDERDAAIARAEKAEATREEFRALNLRALANERDALAQVERLREALEKIRFGKVEADNHHEEGPYYAQAIRYVAIAKAALAATEARVFSEADRPSTTTNTDAKP